MRWDGVSRIFFVFGLGLFFGYFSLLNYIQPSALSNSANNSKTFNSLDPNPPCECLTSTLQKSIPKKRHEIALEVLNVHDVMEKDISTPVPKERFLNCFDNVPETYIQHHNRYFVIYNSVPGRKFFRCDETITLSTQGEINFLHNLIPLAERWQGPISVALYTPDSDYVDAMHVIKYMRDCTSAGELIKDLVSFHFFFPSDAVSEFFPYWKWSDLDASPSDCQIQTDEILHLGTEDLYRIPNYMTYPINVARNIAKEGATTALVLYSDIEMLPSEGLIPKFLAMLEQYRESFLTDYSVTKSVYVVPAFVISPVIEPSDLPRKKTELLDLVRTHKASAKHNQFKCRSCNNLTDYQDWIKAETKENDSEISIFTTTKRKDFTWEPYYIGFKTVPFWDERLMLMDNANRAQASLLCLENYLFHILDGAFLVHTTAASSRQVELRNITRTRHLFQTVIQPEMFALFGENKDCY